PDPATSGQARGLLDCHAPESTPTGARYASPLSERRGFRFFFADDVRRLCDGGKDRLCEIADPRPEAPFEGAARHAAGCAAAVHRHRLARRPETYRGGHCTD